MTASAVTYYTAKSPAGYGELAARFVQLAATQRVAGALEAWINQWIRRSTGEP